MSEIVSDSTSTDPTSISRRTGHAETRSSLRRGWQALGLAGRTRRRALSSRHCRGYGDGSNTGSSITTCRQSPQRPPTFWPSQALGRHSSPLFLLQRLQAPPLTASRAWCPAHAGCDERAVAIVPSGRCSDSVFGFRTRHGHYDHCVAVGTGPCCSIRADVAPRCRPCSRRRTSTVT
jgi:hypothetical protein